MELFPTQPDLSLQISPPNTKPTSKTLTTSTKIDQNHHDLDLGNFWNRALNSQHHHTSTTTTHEPSIGLNSPHPTHSINLDLTHITNQNHYLGVRSNLGFLRPVTRGVPVYYHNTNIPDNHANYITRPRILSSRIPKKRNTRKPRMQWTTILHARFVHAVELLGGHESMLKHFLNLININFFLHCIHDQCSCYEFRSNTQVSS